MDNLPYKITDDLQITSCKLISRLRFRVEFLAHNRIKGEALYGWGNSRFTTLGVNASITDTTDSTDIDTIDELIEDNHQAIGLYLRYQERINESSKS